jgi:DNA-binding LacI/PurR family transcriptional regulator
MPADPASTQRPRAAKKSLKRRESGPTRGAVTIRDVAAAAGVSVATVSNVINGRKGAVGDSTREVVTRTIEALGYRPQASGRGLRNARFNAVGLLIVDDEENYLADPFNGHVVAGWTQVLHEHGYLAVLHGSPRRHIRDAIMVRQFGVDGLCVMLSGSTRERREMIRHLAGLRQPLVLIQETEPLPDEDCCAVRQDDLGGGRIIGEHLAGHGCRRLLVVLPKLEWPALQARLAGVRQAAQHVRPKAEVTVLRTPGESFAEVFAAVREHLQQEALPDAIIGGNDQIAIAAMQAVRKLGHAVPRDVRITGFNAFSVWQYTSPTLTSVASAARDIGAQAAQRMIERIESGRFSQHDVVLPVALQPGESS